MKKRRILLPVIAILLVSGVVFWPRPELLHKGTPVRIWVKTIVTSASNVTEENHAEFATIGPAAIPYLIEWLDDRGSLAARAYRGFYERVPGYIRSRLSRPVDRQLAQRNALNLLKDFGSEATPAVPALLNIVNHTNLQVREDVGGILGQQRDAADQIIPAIIQAFGEVDQVGLNQPLALTSLGLQSETQATLVIEALAEIVVDLSQNYGRGNAALGLAKFGPRAKAAIPSLLEASLDPDPRIRRLATFAILDIDPESAALNDDLLLRNLVEVLNAESPEVAPPQQRVYDPQRIRAIEGLLVFDDISLEARSALENLAKNGSEDVKAAAEAKLTKLSEP